LRGIKVGIRPTGRGRARFGRPQRLFARSGGLGDPGLSTRQYQ
jgi:hypothetical protein